MLFYKSKEFFLGFFFFFIFDFKTGFTHVDQGSIACGKKVYKGRIVDVDDMEDSGETRKKCQFDNNLSISLFITEDRITLL